MCLCVCLRRMLETLPSDGLIIRKRFFTINRGEVSITLYDFNFFGDYTTLQSYSAFLHLCACKVRV